MSSLSRRYDAIIVGGGPAGSTAAWQLARRSVRTLLLDAARFPRVKLCAGWITPRVLETVELDPARYPWTLQPFSTAALELHGRTFETTWPRTASYGIVRQEFDHFLLERARAAGVEVRDGARVDAVERHGDRVLVHSGLGAFEAPIVIGAGGHFCPVARAFGEPSPNQRIVVTQEGETRLGRERLAEVAPRPGVPELFPEPDLLGYAWYFAKGDFLNVGIGALTDGRGLHRRRERFLERLRDSGRLPPSLRLVPFRGHAYALNVGAPRKVAGDGFLLVGDAAGLARDVSGEGIGPAVESATLAAELVAAGRDDVAESYTRQLRGRYGTPAPRSRRRLRGGLPWPLVVRFGEAVCRNSWSRKRLVFEGAFGMG